MIADIIKVVLFVVALGIVGSCNIKHKKQKYSYYKVYQAGKLLPVKECKGAGLGKWANESVFYVETDERCTKAQYMAD